MQVLIESNINLNKRRLKMDWDKLTTEEDRLIGQIARRACQLAPAMEWDILGLEMDLGAAHLADPMDLVKLRDFDPGNLLHDISGIIAHIDRTTGKMNDCFLPRASRG
jgi:hypothetical protein